MVDIEIIKENYRRMPDEQLVRFARLESENLSLEAFHALKDELAARDIDLGIIEDLEDVDIPAKNADNKVTELFIDSLFEFMLDEKSKGTTNHEIYHRLIAKNIGADQSFMLLQLFGDIAKKSLKEVDTGILVGWIIFVAGAILCLFSFESPDYKLLIGAAVIVSVSIRLAKAYAFKKKLIAAIDNNEKEVASDPKDLYQ
jgi:hypothetical protein